MRVDLPAPFSPTMPWIVPGRMARLMSWLAWTSPNHLSMPRSSMTGGAVTEPAAPARACGTGADHVVRTEEPRSPAYFAM